MKMFEQWKGFVSGKWCDEEINVRDFIQRNYTPYEGDEEFLAGPTAATETLWKEITELSEKERLAGGVLKADTAIVSGVNSHEAGYIDKTLEKIVGLQTDEPFKRPMHVSGGLRMAAIFATSTVRPITTACSTPTLPKCAGRVPLIS